MSGPEESNQNKSDPPPEGTDQSGTPPEGTANENEKPVYPPLPDPGPTEGKPGEDGKPMYPPLENGAAMGGQFTITLIFSLFFFFFFFYIFAFSSLFLSFFSVLHKEIEMNDMTETKNTSDSETLPRDTALRKIGFQLKESSISYLSLFTPFPQVKHPQNIQKLSKKQWIWEMYLHLQPMNNQKYKASQVSVSVLSFPYSLPYCNLYAARYTGVSCG